MKYGRIELAESTAFSHSGRDCPLKVLWQSLYKSHSYEEFCMLCDLNQEPNAPITLGAIQEFIYEYSCGGARTTTSRIRLREYRDRLILERFRRGEVSCFDSIKHMLEPEEIKSGRKAYDKWWKELKEKTRA